MAAEIPEWARPGVLGLQVPGERKLRIDDPALQVGPPPMEDPPQPTGVDKMLRQHDGRNTAVVMVEISRHARLPDGFSHRTGLRDIEGQRLLAEDLLAGPGCGECHLAVQGGWRGDVDDVDVVPGDHLLPVGGDLLPAPAIGERPQRRLIAADRDLQHRLGR